MIWFRCLHFAARVISIFYFVHRFFSCFQIASLTATSAVEATLLKIVLVKTTDEVRNGLFVFRLISKDFLISGRNQLIFSGGGQCNCILLRHYFPGGVQIGCNLLHLTTKHDFENFGGAVARLQACLICCAS